jgi:hypothetical protein
MSSFSLAVPLAVASTRACAVRQSRASKQTRRVVSARAGFPNRPVDVSLWESETDVAQWESVKTLVTGLGMDETSADKCMTRAFGWGGQTYWRESKVEEVPLFEDVETRIDFLLEIGVPEDKLVELLGKVPEVLGVPIELLKENVKYVEKNYFMKRSTRNFANYLLRTPQALGNNVDCAGTCVGECNRCWVR